MSTRLRIRAAGASPRIPTRTGPRIANPVTGPAPGALIRPSAVLPMQRPFLTVLNVFFAAAIALAQDPTPPPQPRPKDPDDLGQRLIRKAQTDADEDVMDAIVRLMDESADRLEIRFDPGRPTQEVQDAIVSRLDQAIQMAAAKTCAGKQKTGKAAQGEKRTSPAKPTPGKDERGSDRVKQSKPQDSSDTAGPGVPAATPETDGGMLKEERRAWGHLPARERDEVIQGLNEQSLERYRAWIERYYQSLQESEE